MIRRISTRIPPRVALAAAVTALALLAFLAPAPVPAAAATPHHFRGFCHCSGTFTPDCNTRADCLGAPCLAGPTFC